MLRTRTRLKLDNLHELFLQVLWEADEDGHGWFGDCTIWYNHKPVVQNNKVSVRQTQPLGNICVELNPSIGGACMFFFF